VVFEVRTRQKGSDGHWRSTSYRPYADAEDLTRKLRHLDTPEALELVAALREPKLEYLEIRNPHPKKTFEFHGYRENLPAIPETLARTILGWEFVADVEWRRDCHAPSTRAEGLHIVPRDYLGCIVRADSRGCMQCHDSAGVNTGIMELERDWYGHIRGMDGIFTFHIFDNTSVSATGHNLAVRLNPDLPLRRVARF
jgi:hypothetical protein